MSDLITKQAVLNTLDNADKFLDEERTVEMYKALLTECIKALPSAENDGDLISRQAVLDELEKWDWQDLYLPSHFKQILDDVPSVENKGEWIPISEENLPEDFQNVLVTIVRYDGTKMVRVAEYHENPKLSRKTFRILENNERWEVGEEQLLAWMPKPEPYKAEKPETCKGCLEPCIMYEPDMRACKKKVREVIE